MTDLQILTSHLGILALVATMFICRILRVLSSRMGTVTRMPPYHRWFNVGNAFLGLGTLGYVAQCSAALAGKPAVVLTPDFELLAFHLPLTAGVIINLIVTLKYWGWLAKSR
ncbi:MAG: hypothetical protein JXB35_16020 [Anaerolineae bacterium]|nr:hypothetical protein [Anaerolineae bacterium]